MAGNITVAVRSLILQSAEIAALVGTRVSGDQLPQAELEALEVPSVVLWISSESALDALDGPLGMDQPTFTIQAYDDNRKGASELRKLIRNQIGGFAGLVGEVFIKGVAQRGGETDTTDRTKEGSDSSRFLASQNFRVTYDYLLASEIIP